MVAPALSVFTIASVSAADCRDVLNELGRQTIHDRLEVILVTPDRKGADERISDRFASFHWVDMPRAPTAGEAMSAAIHSATGPFVVYAEEHAFFREDWAERLLEAHASYQVVGFAMENANPETLTSWAHFYGQFGPAVAPVESGEVPMLVGHHASYSRDLLLSYGDLLPGLMEDESVMFLDLRARGIPLYMAGDAISQHLHLSRLGAYMHLDFLGQRGFAAMRARAGHWPWYKRILWACGAPLIPIIRLRRILFHLQRTGRYHHLMPGILTRLLPALVAGGAGESLGYLIGAGNVARQKIPKEFKRDTFLAEDDPWERTMSGP